MTETYTCTDAVEHRCHNGYRPDFEDLTHYDNEGLSDTERAACEGLTVPCSWHRCYYARPVAADDAPELCEHGLSLWLCADPVNHYPSDRQF